MTSTNLDEQSPLTTDEAKGLLDQILSARGYPDGIPRPSSLAGTEIPPGLYLGVIRHRDIASRMLTVRFEAAGPEMVRVRVPDKLALLPRHTPVAVLVGSTGHVMVLPIMDATTALGARVVPDVGPNRVKPLF